MREKNPQNKMKNLWGELTLETGDVTHQRLEIFNL